MPVKPGAGDWDTAPAAACEHALPVIRALIARGQFVMIRVWMACSFEITNEAGRHVLTVPFSDTMPDTSDLD
ncbi:hypothetical protein MEX01_53680 [Methylorubrum extorquens]|uniref:DUF6894 family protein n=1 Tax=Methylorubrum extorquens TaxID=408 RepID=UPI001173FFDF|nr:hypothetical protein MEX01_53680 [Methylorubrum extorquens]